MLNYVDAACVLVLLVSAMGGLQKRFAGMVPQVLAFVVYGVFLYRGFPVLCRYLVSHFNWSEDLTVWGVMLGSLLGGVLVYLLLLRLSARLLEGVGFSESADRRWGLVLGLVRGILLPAYVLTLLLIFGRPAVRDYVKASWSGRMAAHYLLPAAKPFHSDTSLDREVEKVRGEILRRRKTVEVPE